MKYPNIAALNINNRTEVQDKQQLTNINNPVNIEQLQASDPDVSVWVSASAGTGKTKILTDRVLRLLMNGVKPEKILCITFTRAAAGEMNNRINAELAIWANLSPIKLDERLKTTFGNKPTKEQILTASQLFHEKLSSVETLNIQTIHAFCQFILSRFPIEAGVNPSFKVIDEYKTIELVKNIKNNLYMQAAKQSEAVLSKSLELIGSQLHDSAISSLIQRIIEEKNKFNDLFAAFRLSDDYIVALKKYLKINITNHNSAEVESQNILIKLFNYFDSQHQYIDITNIDDKYDKDIAIIKQLQSFMQLNISNKITEFDNLCLLFLTQLGEPRKNIFSKNFSLQYPQIEQFFNISQQYIITTTEQLKTISLLSFSTYIYDIAQYVIAAYTDFKQQNSYLDFDDLIYCTKNLLTNSAAREWVLYKLDGFADHILVDEAQDTNAYQWQIVEALAREFYAGNSANETNRTLFVVGDAKQSIYSFQGADPTSFQIMNHYFADKIRAAGKKFVNIDLSLSYRSLEAINIAVTKVFEHIKQQTDDIFAKQINIKCFRQNGGGRVEIWPLITMEEKALVEPWPLPVAMQEHETTSLLLAKSIAQYINNKLQSKFYIYSKKRVIDSSDFIILVKQRDEFVTEVIRELHKFKIKVAGVDRVNLVDNLAIQDLLCLAKFVLLPDDDLNLACLLKSPFIDLAEEHLYNLATQRGEYSLWRYLQIVEYQNTDQIALIHVASHLKQQLQSFITEYRNNDLAEFFGIMLDAAGYRDKLLSACGIESSEIINEFLDLVTKFQQENSNNLQDFIIWLENYDIEIKRDLEQRDMLRVMTIHGSKGLQAPIVILADTTRITQLREQFLWTAENLALWPGSRLGENSLYKNLTEQKASSNYQEYLRLMYVAMTRAEDELIIFGSHTKPVAPAQSWYNIIKSSLSNIMVEHIIPANLQPYFKQDTFYVFDMYQQVSSIQPIVTENKAKFIPLIDTAPKYQSQVCEKQYLINSPLKVRQATEYGIAIHKLLEILFVTKNLDSVLQNAIMQQLPVQQIEQLKYKITNLFNSPIVQQLLSFDLYCELTIGLNNQSTTILGRPDLVAINEQEIIIVDYKTDRIVPESIFTVSFDYKAQLKKYIILLSSLYPTKKIKVKILWFENITFMDIPLTEL